MKRKKKEEFNEGDREEGQKEGERTKQNKEQPNQDRKMEGLAPPRGHHEFSFGPRSTKSNSSASTSPSPSQLIFDQSILVKRVRLTNHEEDENNQLKKGKKPSPRGEESEEPKGPECPRDEGKEEEEEENLGVEMSSAEGMVEYLRDHLVAWPTLQRHLQSTASSRTLEFTLEVLNSLFSPSPLPPPAPSIASLLPSLLTTHLLGELLLPHLSTLTSSPDRSLLSCLFLIVSHKPSLATQGIILPLLFFPYSSHEGSVQMDLINRLVKDGMGGDDAKDTLLLFLRTEHSLVNQLPPPSLLLSSSSSGIAWTLPRWGESLLEVFINFANSKGPATPELWSLLRQSLSERCPPSLFSSKKLGTLLFTLASKRGVEVSNTFLFFIIIHFHS